MAGKRSHRQRSLRGGFWNLFGTSQNQMGTSYSTSSYNPSGSSSWNLFGSTPSTGSSYSTSSYNPSGSSSWNLFGSTPSTGMSTSPIGSTGMGSTGMSSTGMGTTGMGSTGMSTSPMGSTGMSTSPMGSTGSMGQFKTMGSTAFANPMNSQRRFGGRTRGRRMRGGFNSNISTTDLAAHAAPFSGPTAQPHNLVGGRTRRRRRKGGKKGGKTYRHRK
jgi:hypothetical protein